MLNAIFSFKEYTCHSFILDLHVYYTACILERNRYWCTIALLTLFSAVAHVTFGQIWNNFFIFDFIGQNINIAYVSYISELFKPLPHMPI